MRENGDLGCEFNVEIKALHRAFSLLMEGSGPQKRRRIRRGRGLRTFTRGVRELILDEIRKYWT